MVQPPAGLSVTQRKDCGGSVWAAGSPAGRRAIRVAGCPLVVASDFGVGTDRSCLAWVEGGQSFHSMSRSAEPSRRHFLRSALLAAAGMMGSGSILESETLLSAYAGRADA